MSHLIEGVVARLGHDVPWVKTVVNPTLVSELVLDRHTVEYLILMFETKWRSQVGSRETVKRLRLLIDRPRPNPLRLDLIV